jgi:lipopolysaccharide biosynthesis glycosyltransferase
MDIPPETCLFNAGVFVVDMKKFKQWNISAKLEYWATMNVKHKLFLEGPSHVPALVVFHNLYTELDPKWHIVHLGNPPEKVPPYDSDFLHSEACLLHWDGSRKPWLYPSQTGADIWRKYAVYDLVQPSI